MLYIQQKLRPDWEETIESLIEKIGNSSARFAYLLQVVASKLGTTQKYSNYERAYGCLNCIRSEYQRRVFFMRSNKRPKVVVEEFDLVRESQQIDTIFVHGVEKADQGGHLNYLVSSVINGLLMNYSFEKVQIDQILEDVTEEIYLKILGPYEDQKISSNGDVYDPELTQL